MKAGEVRRDVAIDGGRVPAAVRASMNQIGRNGYWTFTLVIALADIPWLVTVPRI